MGKENDRAKMKKINWKGKAEQMRKMGQRREKQQMEQDPEQMQKQMEKDLEKLNRYGSTCDCFGCRSYGNGEIKIKHPWFFGKYRERKERERYEKFVKSREKTLVELKKILADYEERLGIKDTKNQDD